MVQATPFSLVDQLFDRVTSTFQPPAWLVSELQHRGVLLINHVLMQEPEAMARLARQTGRVASVQWRLFNIKLLITPAGLIDLAEPGVASDLHLSVTESSPTSLVQAVVAGEKPPVRIEGDVQFAAEINWIVDHVRWDLEEDLARVVGDGPAHTAVQAVKSLVRGLKDFVTRFPATSIVRDKDGL
jgi:ubiquinone biosynthesis protein UbiJ